MTLLEQALAIVGLVVALHASPIPLPFKPLSCGFCTCFWVAVAWFSYAWWAGSSWPTAVAGVGVTALVAGLVAAMTPLFRSSGSGSASPS